MYVYIYFYFIRKIQLTAWKMYRGGTMEKIRRMNGNGIDEDLGENKNEINSHLSNRNNWKMAL